MYVRTNEISHDDFAIFILNELYSFNRIKNF